MKKKTLKMTGKTVVIHAVLMIAILFSYTLLIALIPSKAQVIQRLYVCAFLVSAAISDIRSGRIPFVVCIGLINLSLVYAVFFSLNFAAVITGIIITVLLLAVRLISKEAIGTGDVLLVGFSIMILPIDEILGFIFLTFLFSSILGIIMSIKRRKFMNAVVPLAPCIATAFIMQSLLR